ncbi:hypothetical protein HanPI659440_Chr08g0289711 [Helianthus annuus]|nr:hypothetical protein HanPI659440_Chr08g0289711 [Helianthus annuus]
MKSQRNALLIATALVFYWILYSVTKLVRVDQLNQWVDHNGWRWWLVTVMEVAD